MTFQISYFK